MSSRRRSDHPPPTWSRRSSYKPRAATGVSFIYAQPLQGSPLRSAMDNLPAIGIDDSASFISEMSRKRERREEEDGSEISDDGTQQKEVGDGASVRSARGSTHSGGIQVSSLQDATSTPKPHIIALTTDADTEAPTTTAAALTESPKTATEPLLPEPQVPPVVSLPPPSAPQKLVDDSKPAGRRSSWFSFSRSREVLAMSTSVPEQSAMSPPPADVRPSSASVKEPTAPTLEGSPLATPSPTRTEYDAGTQLLDPKVSPKPIVAPLPASDNPTAPVQPPQAIATSNTTSTISSVDEEVPPSRGGTLPAPSPAVLQSQTLGVPDRRPSVSSLNPSSSRFSLRIPLLGRSKVPLDQAMAAAQNDSKPVPSTSTSVEETPALEDKADTLEPQSAAPAAGTPTDPQPPSAAPGPEGTNPEPEQTTPPSTEHVQEDAPVDTLNAQPTPASSSWWSYIGLGASSSSVADPPEVPIGAENSTEADPHPVAAETVEDPALSATSAPPAQTEASPNQADAVPSYQEQEQEPGPQIEIRITASPSDDRPQSLLSADTTQTQGSAWYSPWAWMGSASTMPPTAPDVTSQDSERPDGHAKTESELVKEEALARGQPDSSPPSSATVELATVVDPPSPVSVTNPIESTIATNRSGWASFFMSRALITKTITDDSVKRDENGMEVMDIDEDEGQEATEISGLPSSPRSVASTSYAQPSPVQQPQKSPMKPDSREREPRKPGPVAPPLTNSESIKKETTKTTAVRSSSPAPSTKKSGTSTPVQPKPLPPNLVLPTWKDTFHTAPRSTVPRAPAPPKSALSKTLSVVSGVLFAKDDHKQGSSKGKERQSEHDFEIYGKELPKAYDILGQTLDPAVLSGNCRVVIIGVAGWMPGAVTRTLAGGLPSSSTKFATMLGSALEKFEEDHGIKFRKVTQIPLEGDGTIARKVSRVYAHLMENNEWLEDLHLADVIFVAAHSQGSIVSAHLLDRLIREGHILTPRNVDILNNAAAAIAPGGSIQASASRTQKICCLALCGIHLGPLRYLKTSSLLQPYIQYFENAAARELFEFQDTETEVHKSYVKALRTVMDHGAKMVYIASLNDQVVPIYSGLFTAASHPRILRALYIDGDAYHSSDFLSNLLVLLIRIMNVGLSDSGLLAHLSEATAGTLSGIGHSTAYEELNTYSLAVNYAFLANDGADVRTDLVIEPFNAVNEQNDYEIPWSLRDLIADERVAHFFHQEFAQLRDAFDDWQPRTSILRDVKRKLQPIQRLSSIRGSHSRL